VMMVRQQRRSEPLLFPAAAMQMGETVLSSWCVVKVSRRSSPVCRCVY
jgi:hypothetical protein